MDSPPRAKDTVPSDTETKSPPDMPSKKVIIIGAGISGLILAQYLRKSNIPFSIFERDADFNTRGVGWGLTLHWSLPALRFLLPKELVHRLPETYVDQKAVENGEVSTFPFFDLATGELKGASPKAPESQRIRVTREKFRQLLATGIEIHWNKTCSGCIYYKDTDSIVASFEDGSACFGGLLAGCDGSRSRIRRALFPESENEIHKIPVAVLGFKVDYSSEKIKPLRELDPFFFQGTSSENDTFIYFSMLDAPGNNPTNSVNHSNNYTCQIVVSWPLRAGFLGSESITPCPSTNVERLDLIRTFADTWAEPFRSLGLDILEGTDIKPVELNDWAPPVEPEFQPDFPVALLGDAFHPMAMYRGEGANHAILDVLDFVTKGATYFWETDHGPVTQEHNQPGYISNALERYGRHVIQRARPAVLTSRKACMDAHDFKRIGPDSPLLSRRMMNLTFEEESLSWG